MSVFLSYARSDSTDALDLARRVRPAGVSLWVDQLDIPAGAPWDSTIQSKLRDCESVLLLLSPRSASSPNVLDEVAYALDSKKQVIPVILEHCEKPFRLHRAQHIELSRDLEATVQFIVAAVTGGHASRLGDAYQRTTSQPGDRGAGSHTQSPTPPPAAAPKAPDTVPPPFRPPIEPSNEPDPLFGEGAGEYVKAFIITVVLLVVFLLWFVNK